MNLSCDEPARAEDLAALRVLLWGYIREMRAIYDGTRMVAELDDATWTRELAALEGKYGAPGGALLIARDAGIPVGCVAMRGLDATTCEMKRLYVAPVYRGRGLSRLLVRRLAAIALARGYERIVFDVGWRQSDALAAYARMGFEEIAPYHGGSDWFLAHARFFAGRTRDLARINGPLDGDRQT